MKRCPVCGNTYTDETLRYCLQDGAKLLRSSDAPRDFSLDKTLQDNPSVDRSEPPPTEKFDSGAAPSIEGYAEKAAPARSQSSTDKTDAVKAPVKRASPVVVALITAVVLLAGFGIFYLLRNKNSGNVNTEASRDSTVKITASASSTRAPEQNTTYEAANVLDGSILTAWSEGASGAGIGEWIRCDFDREVNLRRILITPGYFKSTALWMQNNRLAAATFTFSDGTSRSYTFPDLQQEQRLDVGGVKTSSVKMTIDKIYGGSVDREDTLISQMTFEWNK